MMLKKERPSVYGVLVTFLRGRFSPRALSNEQPEANEPVMTRVTTMDPRRVWRRLCRFGQTNIRDML